jgi:hypothetical protein
VTYLDRLKARRRSWLDLKDGPGWLMSAKERTIRQLNLEIAALEKLEIAGEQTSDQ